MKTCRICLKFFGEVRNIGKTDERSFINGILKSHKLPEINDKHYACYECLIIIRKMYKYHERVLLAQRTLVDLLAKSNNKVSIQALQRIDRSKLDANIGISKIEFISIDNNIESTYNLNAKGNRLLICYNSDDPVKEENCPIKREIEVDSLNTLDTKSSENDDNEVQITPKTEILDTINISDDDEPNCHMSNNNKNADDITTDSKELIVVAELVPLADSEVSDQDYDPLRPETSTTLTWKRGKKSRRGRKRKPKTTTAENTTPKKVYKYPNRHYLASHRSIRSLIKEDITEKNILSTKRSVKTKTFKDYFTEETEPVSENESKHKKRESDVEFNPELDSNASSNSNSEYEFTEEGGVRKKKIVYPRQCLLCTFEALSGKEHWRHYLTDHPNEEYPFSRKDCICDVCGKRVTKSTLKSHHRHDDVQQKCATCGLIFKNYKRLCIHNRDVHKGIQLICDYCDKKFIRKSELTLHIRAHMGIKRFKCPHCDHRVLHRGNLKPHLISVHKIVVDDKPFPYEQKKTKKLRKYIETSSDSDEPLQKVCKKKNRLRKYKKQRSTNKSNTLKDQITKSTEVESEKRNISQDNGRKTDVDLDNTVYEKQDLQSTDAEKDQATNKKIVLSNENLLQSPNENQTSNESQLQTPNECHLQTLNESQLKTPKECQLQSQNESLLQTLHESPLQTLNESQQQILNESQLQTLNESQLPTPNERQLPTPNESQLHSNDVNQISTEYQQLVIEFEPLSEMLD